MNREKILNEMKNILDTRLSPAIKKLFIQKRRESYLKSPSNEGGESLNERMKMWYKSIDTFYPSFHSILALSPLVARERQIIDFQSQEITVVKVDYEPYNGISFNATHSTRFSSDMKKEIEDCIIELANKKYEHIVDNYKPENDTERFPPEPLSNGMLKYSGFYLFQFDYKYTSMLADILYKANLITDPTTNGWTIPDEVAEEIITLLNSKYKDNQVLQKKRIYNKTGREAPAIIPTNFSVDYFPKNIVNTSEFRNITFDNGRIKEDAISLYEFIFYITLSTQMKNSIYDTSSVSIVSGRHKLNQTANLVIEGSENWELLSGRYIKNLKANDSASEYDINKTVVLPTFRSGDILTPKSIYPYTYASRRPPRFGIGRFAAQVLEKDDIGTVLEQDTIISNLLDSKAVLQIQKMLHPQEIAIFLISWLEEYCPLLLSLEYMKEVDEKIEGIIEGQYGLDTILDEFDRVIEEAFQKADYKEDDAKPSEAKIALAKSIISKYRLTVSDDLFESNIKIDLLLAKYPVAEPIKIGSCPECNKQVFQKEFIDKESGEVRAYFSCEAFKREGGCTFSVWDSYINKFFTERGINLYTVEERAESLKKILPRKRGYLFADLLDVKNQKKYNAKISINSFVNKDTKKTIWYLKESKQ